ncbi:DUF4180 domain-containing protein [Pyxidicoccus sp. 3LG]
MTTKTLELGGVRVLALSAEGPTVGTANDLISLAWEHQADLVAVPAERLGDAFFKLATGVAGEIAQKFVNYRLRLAVLGDISAQVENSKALKSFVYESNQGSQLWFLDDLDALAVRLSSPAP